MPLAIRNVRRRVGDTSGFDPDAAAYIRAVQSADNAALEPAVAQAINAFVLGCKADGIWSAIKASCILMGARTLNGALTPLTGSAPTNNNFVSGDYNRKTGIVGNGSTKFIDANRAGNADGQNDIHVSVYASALPTGGNTGTYYGLLSNDLVQGNNTSNAFRSRGVFQTAAAGWLTATGFAGTSRTGSTAWTYRFSGTTYTGNTNGSGSASTQDFYVFARNNDTLGTSLYTNARLAFYSIGSSLTLATLDTRVSTLYTALGNAIP